MDRKEEFMDMYADRLFDVLSLVVRCWAFGKCDMWGAAHNALTRAQEEIEVLREAVSLMEDEDEQAALNYLASH